jgi:ribonuclease HI
MEIEVFTDGSFIKSHDQKNIIAGYGIYFPNNELSNISRPFLHKPITNQRAELYAIYVAIFKITKHLDVKKITIYSDSEYSIKSLTVWMPNWIDNGWKKANGKKVENQDILKLINNLMQKYEGDINFIHVRSHTGKHDYRSLGNEQADKLATAGAKKIN